MVGSGPAGTAAVYAAELGKKVILVERDKAWAAYALNRGCIPSKACCTPLMRSRPREIRTRGITFGAANMNVAKLRAGRMASRQTWRGIAQLAKMRRVRFFGWARLLRRLKTLRLEPSKASSLLV